MDVIIETVRDFKVLNLFILFIYISILLFVFCDLWSGMQKAKERGEFRSSYGLRKTIKKICSYYNMLFVLTIIDMLLMCWVYTLSDIMPLPLFTSLGGLFVGIIEFKSIYEKNTDKQKALIQEAAKILAKLNKCHDSRDIVNLLDSLNELDEK